MRYRIEKDSIGEVQLPGEAYYGIHTYRAKNNFEITKRDIPRQMIKALAIVKKAAAKANADAGTIPEKVSDAIMLTCDEILNGKLHGQFITDLIQGGAGTSINMNANEVIANRANEMLGGKKGTYEFVHPFDHVNCSQSTNDVIPTAGKIAVIKQIKKLNVELKKLRDSMQNKAQEFNDVVKMGRTHLQEAVPITLGQEFKSYANALSRDIKRLDDAIENLSEVNMGATAVGTGLNAPLKYSKKIIYYLCKFSGEKLTIAKDLIDNTRHFDCFVNASNAIKTLATNLAKIANDIRLMASSGINEIVVPYVQQGSSIIPAKYNPVIPEVVNQVSFYVMGLDTTISVAASNGQMEINPFIPIILMCMFEEITNIRHAIRAFNEYCITGITANTEDCRKHVENSIFIVTALTPHIGYDKATQIALEAKERNISIKEIVLEKKLLTKEAVDKILDIDELPNGGILGEEFLNDK